MKNLRFLLIISIFISPLFLFGQSKLVMGGGLIISKIEGALQNSIWDDGANQDFNPFVGFSYEYNLNQNFFLSTNANYSKQQVFASGLFDINTPISFEPFSSDINFVQISAGALLNCKIFSSEKYPIFLRGFNIGLGLNVDHLRDFEENLFGTPVEFPNEDNRTQFGLLYHLSWDYKKFRLTYNIGQGLKMFGNHENLVTSTDWKTLSASYIYTLRD